MIDSILSMPNEADYKRVLKKAERELAAEKRDAQQRELRIARLEQTVASLRTLVNPDIESDLGLTDAIRQILRTTQRPLLAVDVRKNLNALGTSLAEHSNAMASVHAILARLIKSNEAMLLTYAGTGKWYWWTLNGPPPINPTVADAILHTGRNAMDAANTAVQANYAHRRNAHIGAVKASAAALGLSTSIPGTAKKDLDSLPKGTKK